MPDYGLDIAIPFSGGDPDPTLPWADDDDAMLVPGSVLLVEPNHSSNPLIGTPNAQVDVANVAWKRLRDAVGSAVFTGRIDNGNVGTAGNILTVTAKAAGNIVPGQIISGSGIPINQFVRNQLTGTPGAEGTYTVSATSGAQTLNIASTVITANPLDATTGSAQFIMQNDNALAFARERTPKGGFHIAASQTNQNVGSQYNSITAKAAVMAYIMSYPTRSFYFSVWDRVTRVALEVNSLPPQMAFNSIQTGGTANLVAIFGPRDVSPNLPASGAAQRIGYYDSSGNVLGNRHRAMGISSTIGTIQGMFSTIFIAGQTAAWSDATAYSNKSASRVFYRGYVEDLTASGRSYADVLAIDQALYAAAFGAGGRYNGDTFTAPSI